MSFHLLLLSEPAPDSLAPEEKALDWALPAMLAQFSLLPKAQAETATTLELSCRHNPARTSECQALAAKVQSRCRLPVETRLASAAPVEARALVAAAPLEAA